MKRTKINHYLRLLSIGFILSGMVITLSSKDDDIGNDGPPCETLAGDDARIQILFEPTANFDQFRAPGFAGFIPSPDLRFGDAPGGFLLDRDEADEYYCVVTVTSPQCVDWIWEEALTLENSNGNGRMDIKVPPDGYDTRIEVKYYEISDSPATTQNFNVPLNASRVIYSFVRTYLGAPGIPPLAPEPVFLDVSDFEEIGILCDANPFLCGDTDWDIGKGSANLDDVLDDYENINTFIHNRQ